MGRRVAVILVAVIATLALSVGLAAAQDSPPPPISTTTTTTTTTTTAPSSSVLPTEVTRPPATVLGEEVRRPLVRTGTDAMRQIYFGAAVAAVGVVLVLSTRRRRKARLS